jgi:hypothetical protein
MAEAQAEGKSSRLGGWIKAAVGGLFGLASGGLLMYLSPLVDRVIKPNKPLANFAVELQGTQVTFQNRSTGAAEGWWDFGDGSALEPYSPNQPSIPHTYPRPGSYTAKLSVRSLFGEESDRTVNVQLDGSAVTAPEITALAVESIRPDTCAPATFRVSAKVKNDIDLHVWAGGGEHALEVQAGPPVPEKYFTFRQPGKHTIRLAVVKDKGVIQKEVTVQVAAARPGAAMALVSVANDAVPVQTTERRQNVRIAFPDKHADATYAFTQEIPAERGWRITAAQLGQHAADPAVKDARVTVTADGSKAILTGKLIRPSGLLRRNALPPVWVPEVILKLERRGATETRPAVTLTANLPMPGSTSLPLPRLPPGWELKQRKIAVEVFNGQQSTPLPANGLMMLQNHLWRVATREAGDRVLIDVTAAGN